MVSLVPCGYEPTFLVGEPSTTCTSTVDCRTPKRTVYLYFPNVSNATGIEILDDDGYACRPCPAWSTIPPRLRIPDGPAVAAALHRWIGRVLNRNR